MPTPKNPIFFRKKISWPCLLDDFCRKQGGVGMDDTFTVYKKSEFNFILYIKK